MTRASACIAALLISAGCGGDDAGDEPIEVIDAGRSLDSAAIACADSGDCAGEPFARLCAETQCVECTQSSDCGDITALGPTCDTASRQCRCENDPDCEDNRNGPVCNQIARACGCVTDQDCPDPQKCELEPYLGSGVRTCQPR